MGNCASASGNRYFEDQVFQEFFDKIERIRSKELQQAIVSQYQVLKSVEQPASQEIRKQQKISIQLFYELCTSLNRRYQLNEAETAIMRYIGTKFFKRAQLNLEIRIHSQIEQEEQKKIKIMVIGITGVGKSSFINTFTNFIYDETKVFDQNIRYKAMAVDKSANSQTRKCNCYTFTTNQGFQIELIDTPGLCDTNGQDSDSNNLQEIESYLLKNERENYLDFVFFVSNSRLMEKYRKNDMSNLYIQTKIQDVLKFIPKKMQDRILHIITFSDFSPVNMDFYLSNSIFQPQFDERSDPQSFFFQFENNVIYCNDNTQLNMLQYLRNKSNHEKLIKLINSIMDKNQENLNVERKSNIKAIQSIINNRLNLKNNYKKLQEILKIQSEQINKAEKWIHGFQRLEQGLAATSEFTRLVPKQIIKQIILQGQQNNNCQTCNQTCHLDCTETSLNHCVVMRQESCMICKHDINVHYLSDQYIYKEFIMEIETVENIKNENEEYQKQRKKQISEFQKIKEQLEQQKRQSKDFKMSIDNIVKQLADTELFSEDLQQQVRRALFQETEFLEFKIVQQIESLILNIEQAGLKLEQSRGTQQQQQQ